MPSHVSLAVPMVHVGDVRRTTAFYALLGFAPTGVHHDDDGTLLWTRLCSEKAEMMFVCADEPIDNTKQGVLFYLYTRDLVALREHLLSNNVKAGEIAHPFYMPQGEMRVEDPDGYCLMIAQAD